ncbi:N-acetylmuramic acid 6-phosphate etherase [Halanaerobium saccharolyticum]|jgi:N-acetylmuramic acid 6-phosphate etherase|uniref:N-acetylmuramic acid 6-phosphate etherase n=1 Tax=Halanaerobium saccharolyticum TaxID=43595 RepID=A0A4R6RYQ4_9FIRM|nr:N-acetylmuramic acid 6-phosphate etherase [Halanaerobium saccharolyticum]TDP92250.1 N-acetylmuramic acid 6-phosphate etherase [Halanaerobium saccharolyticum]
MAENMEKRITEQRNPNTYQIDELQTADVLKIINQEDKKVAAAVNKIIPKIQQVIDRIAPRMKKGGRLFYVGAGTSGRLGILDAVECKPTFSVSPERVIGILAGGEKAMFRSQEDIEDNAELGAEKIRSYEISPNDCVVGIAASGKTPFVIGAVEAARKEGAFTAALVCNQDSALAAAAEMGMAVIVGPEVVTGSTRMKAGTAQKMILNMISTTVMIKQGKVYSNLMVDLQPTNDKLRSRAQNIFKIITAAEDQIAAEYLKRANYELKEAVIMYEKGVELKEAQKLLAENDGVLKKVIN